MERRSGQLRGIPDRLRQFSGGLKSLPGKVHDLFIGDLHEPEVDLAKRKTLRLLTWGGLGTAIAVGSGWSIYYEQNTQNENPWKKLKKLGPDEIYYYSGVMIVGPEKNLFTAPLEDLHSYVVFMANGLYKTRNAPVILSEKEEYGPQEHSSVGVMTDNKGLLFATSQFVSIEGGSFKKARKTNDPNKFIDIET